MKRFDFMIAYDIASVKRLRQVAKLLEQHAIRIQYSIFFYSNVTLQECTTLVKELKMLIDDEEDDVRIYRIQKEKSFHLRSGVDLKFPTIIGAI